MAPVENPNARLLISGFNDLLPRLQGHVFHVTQWRSVSSIQARGVIAPNLSGIPSPFGTTENGYFRSKNCVSFFDYRAYGTADWEEHAHKCLPTLPLKPDDPIGIFFLSVTFYDKLLSWRGWKEEQAWSKRVVPHVECGFPGEVPLSAIERLLCVEMQAAHGK